MTEQHEWVIDIAEGGIFRNTDDDREFMNLDEAQCRLNKYETLKAENETLLAWQRAARKQHPDLEKLIAAIEPKGEGEVIEIVNPPKMWNPNE